MTLGLVVHGPVARGLVAVGPVARGPLGQWACGPLGSRVLGPTGLSALGALGPWAPEPKPVPEPKQRPGSVMAERVELRLCAFWLCVCNSDYLILNSFSQEDWYRCETWQVHKSITNLDSIAKREICWRRETPPRHFFLFLLWGL